MKLTILLALLLAGCTTVTINKPDGTKVVINSFFQDAQVGKLTFAKSTTQPSESFTLEGYDQKARVEALNKVLDILSKGL